MVPVNFLLTIFTDLEMKAFDIPKLRGYFAAKYPEQHLFHNHLPDGGQDFRYPRIQYRIIDGHPALIGIHEGLELMKQVFLETRELQIGDDLLIVNERMIKLVQQDFGETGDYHSYRFASPWMALNQENYSDYLKMNTMQQKQKLKSILRGNLLTLAKGFNYTIADFDAVEVDGWFKPVERNFHKIPMQCFTGEFTTNFLIPDLLGLGKQVARGFGVVKRIMEER